MAFNDEDREGHDHKPMTDHVLFYKKAIAELEAQEEDEQPRTLEIKYQLQEEGHVKKYKTEIVFEDPFEGDQPGPRLLVSLQSVLSLRSLCEREFARVGVISKTLAECRSSYLKELDYLREQLLLKTQPDQLSATDFVHNYEVYWYTPPRYVDEDLKEYLQNCIRWTNKKLIEENFELTMKLKGCNSDDPENIDIAIKGLVTSLGGFKPMFTRILAVGQQMNREFNLKRSQAEGGGGAGRSERGRLSEADNSDLDSREQTPADGSMNVFSPLQELEAATKEVFGFVFKKAGELENRLRETEMDLAGAQKKSEELRKANEENQEHVQALVAAAIEASEVLMGVTEELAEVANVPKPEIPSVSAEVHQARKAVKLLKNATTIISDTMRMANGADAQSKIRDLEAKLRDAECGGGGAKEKAYVEDLERQQAAAKAMETLLSRENASLKNQNEELQEALAREREEAHNKAKKAEADLELAARKLAAALDKIKSLKAEIKEWMKKSGIQPPESDSEEEEEEELPDFLTSYYKRIQGSNKRRFQLLHEDAQLYNKRKEYFFTMKYRSYDNLADSPSAAASSAFAFLRSRIELDASGPLPPTENASQMEQRLQHVAQLGHLPDSPPRRHVGPVTSARGKFAKMRDLMAASSMSARTADTIKVSLIPVSVQAGLPSQDVIIPAQIPTPAHIRVASFFLQQSPKTDSLASASVDNTLFARPLLEKFPTAPAPSHLEVEAQTNRSVENRQYTLSPQALSAALSKWEQPHPDLAMQHLYSSVLLPKSDPSLVAFPNDGAAVRPLSPVRSQPMKLAKVDVAVPDLLAVLSPLKPPASWHVIPEIVPTGASVSKAQSGQDLAADGPLKLAGDQISGTFGSKAGRLDERVSPISQTSVLSVSGSLVSLGISSSPVAGASWQQAPPKSKAQPSEVSTRAATEAMPSPTRPKVVKPASPSSMKSPVNQTIAALLQGPPLASRNTGAEPWPAAPVGRPAAIAKASALPAKALPTSASTPSLQTAVESLGPWTRIGGSSHSTLPLTNTMSPQSSQVKPKRQASSGLASKAAAFMEVPSSSSPTASRMEDGESAILSEVLPPLPQGRVLKNPPPPSWLLTVQ